MMRAFAADDRAVEYVEGIDHAHVDGIRAILST